MRKTSRDKEIPDENDPIDMNRETSVSRLQATPSSISKYSTPSKNKMTGNVQILKTYSRACSTT